jgi:poly(3-hydroxybutyrate) depolymerase
MKTALLVLLLVGCSAAQYKIQIPRFPPSTPQGGTFTTYTTTWNGISRTYSLYAPNSMSPNPAMVFCLHETIPDSTGTNPPIHWCNNWKTYADQYGYLLVAPVSTWNQAVGKWFWDAFNLDYLFAVPPDDSGFIRNLIQTVTPQYNANPAQIFVYGLSSGGFVAHRVGIDSSDLVAAIASSSGMLWAATSSVPDVVAPVSVLQCEGSEDMTVPPCKGTLNAWGQKNLPDATVDDIINYWLAQNGLPPNTGAPMCTDGELTEGVTGYDALGENGVEVEYVLQEGVGHGCSSTWPATINEFFQTHPQINSQSQ